jgi:hypothetical protein
VHLDQETAEAWVQAIVYRSPRLYELPQSRWSYQGLRQVCPWLRPLPDAGICQVLLRLEVCYKRGRVYVHSPDQQYVRKLVRILRAYREALAQPERIVFLFEDEHTFCRNPTQAPCYAGVGAAAQQARLYAGYDSTRREAFCLNPVSGELITLQRNHFPAEIIARVPGLCRGAVSAGRDDLHRFGQLAGALRRPGAQVAGRPEAAAFVCCPYLPTRPGQTRSKRYGASSIRRWLTCIHSAPTGKACARRWILGLSSGVRGLKTCSSTLGWLRVTIPSRPFLHTRD